MWSASWVESPEKLNNNNIVIIVSFFTIYYIINRVYGFYVETNCYVNTNKAGSEEIYRFPRYSHLNLQNTVKQIEFDSEIFKILSWSIALKS